MKHDTNIFSNLFNNLQLWGWELTSCMYKLLNFIIFFSAHHAKIEVNHYDRAVLTIFWSFCTLWLKVFLVCTSKQSCCQIQRLFLRSWKVFRLNVQMLSFKKSHCLQLVNDIMHSYSIAINKAGHHIHANFAGHASKCRKMYMSMQ